MTRNRTRVRFQGAHGHQLVGLLESPDGAVSAYALFAPCFTCPKDAKAIVRISEQLAASGIAVLRYDVTGSGESEGSFDRTGLNSQVGDLRAAASFLEHEYAPPKIAIGISLGGAVALRAALDLPGLVGVVTVNSPANTRRLAAFLRELAPEVLDSGTAEVNLLGRTTRIGEVLLKELESHDVEQSVLRLQRPLLVCHAPSDEVVPIEDGHRLFEIAAHPKSFFAIAGGDHLLLNDRQLPAHVADVIAAWASRFLGDV